MKLNLEGEIELTALVDLVSQRLKINIIYDEKLSNNQNRVTVRAPAEMPVSSLLPLLESALKMKGFAIVDTDPKGWKRIVGTENLRQAARTLKPGETLEDRQEQARLLRER